MSQTIVVAVTKCHNEPTKQAENRKQGTTLETETSMITTLREQHERCERT